MTVLMATDFSAKSSRALRQAAWFAYTTKQELVVVHAIEELDGQYGWLLLVQTPEEIESQLRINAGQRLQLFVDETLASFSHRDDVDVSTRVVPGDILDVLSDIVEQEEISLVVCGAQGQSSLSDYFIASTPNELIRFTEGPVLIVPNIDEDLAIEKILVSVDLQEDTLALLAEARKIALELGAKVYPCFVIQWPTPMFDPLYSMTIAPDQRQEIRAHQKSALDAMCAKAQLADVLGEVMLLDGDVERTLQDTAGVIGADLIMMGTHTRRGFRRFLLGNLSERVLRDSPCSLYVVPMED